MDRLHNETAIDKLLEMLIATAMFKMLLCHEHFIVDDILPNAWTSYFYQIRIIGTMVYRP